MRKHLVIRLLALLAIVCATPLPAAGRRAIVHPELRGVNTFYSDGVSGIALEIPAKVKWWRDNIDIDLGKGTEVAYVAFRNRRADDLCDLCFFGTFTSQWRRGPFRNPYVNGACTGDSGREVGCPIFAGVSELYFMGDGPFTVTMKFPELAGRLHLAASGEVDGWVERVPAQCITPDCGLVAGRTVGTIGRGRPAFAQILAYVQAVRSEVNPTVQNVTACAYPGFFTEDKSADPDEYPLGCDITDPQDPASEEMLSPFLTNSGALGGVGVSGKTHGSQYLAYTIHHREAVPPSAVDAYAMFLNAGIHCPSRDFVKC